MDDAFAELGHRLLAVKNYICGQNENRSLSIAVVKKRRLALDGADAASIKLQQNNYLTQFILQTAKSGYTYPSIGNVNFEYSESIIFFNLFYYLFPLISIIYDPLTCNFPKFASK